VGYARIALCQKNLICLPPVSPSAPVRIPENLAIKYALDFPTVPPGLFFRIDDGGGPRRDLRPRLGGLIVHPARPRSAIMVKYGHRISHDLVFFSEKADRRKDAT
jgi:hypothetical protein